MRILLVEDDRSIATSLVDGLEAAGMSVEHVATGAGALEAATASTVDLVLLDLGLPDMDGRDVVRELRTRSRVPVIMLTARSDEFDRVLGLELGADDYVTKPFSLRELIARIRAVARRTSPGGGPGIGPTGGSEGQSEAAAGAPSTEALTGLDVAIPQSLGRLSIDRRTRRVHLDRSELHLTAKEFDLLAYLATDPGAVRTRTEILEQVWDEHWYGPSKTVDAHVASIRKKLGASEWIEAVRGVGFRLEPR